MLAAVIYKFEIIDGIEEEIKCHSTYNIFHIWKVDCVFT